MTTQTQTQSNPLNDHNEPRILSDLIVAYLEQLGVEYVFGLPGGHITSLYDSLAQTERRGGPRAIITRHESGAAFMAAGYARETGKIGVCCATTGPGTTNIITGMTAAYADHVPLLVITGQTLLSIASLGALQECAPYQGPFPDIVDTVGMLEHCTCYNSLVTHPAQLEKKLAAALITALQPLQGPAHLSIPVDILRSPGPESIAYPNLARLLSTPSSYVDSPALEELWQALNDVLSQGHRVALFIGHECAGASQEIMAFAEMINAPVVTSLRGKSWVDPYHPLARGIFGAFGHQTARQALADEAVDLILAVGASFGQWATAGWKPTLFNHKLVHIHHSNTYFARSPMARLHVCGTIKTIFQELITRLETTPANEKLRLQPSASPLEVGEREGSSEEKYRYVPPQLELQAPESYQSQATPIKPQRLIYELRQHFPPETRFLIDTGNCLAWTVHYLFLAQPENYRLLSTGQPSTGWAPGGAVGAALGAPNTPVVCITGDGSFLMYGQEITVAVAERLPVIFVILNDRSYGMIKHRHYQTGTETLDFAVPPVDFSLLAKAVGAKGYTIRQPEDFEQLDYQAICNHPGPTVLDVHIDPEESPPIGV